MVNVLGFGVWLLHNTLTLTVPLFPQTCVQMGTDKFSDDGGDGDDLYLKHAKKNYQ